MSKKTALKTWHRYHRWKNPKTFIHLWPGDLALYWSMVSFHPTDTSRTFLKRKPKQHLVCHTTIHLAIKAIVHCQKAFLLLLCLLILLCNTHQMAKNCGDKCGETGEAVVKDKVTLMPWKNSHRSAVTLAKIILHCKPFDGKQEYL